MCFLGNSAIMICSCKVEVHLPPAMSHKSSIYAVKHEMTSSDISLEGLSLVWPGKPAKLEFNSFFRDVQGM